MHARISRHGSEHISRRIAASFAIALVACIATVPALAQTESVLYSFCSLSSCADGEQPFAGVVMDANGNLYGTTIAGGLYGAGVVFKIASDGSETVLHSFGAGTDGRTPTSSLLLDREGNIYGTAQLGGTSGEGMVFKLTPDGTETVLYNFCPNPDSACTDGTTPLGGLVADAQGNLYGTTWTGGSGGGGTVFKITPGGTFSVVHSFSGNDGYQPTRGLTIDSAGNLYGMTSSGGYVGLCGNLGPWGCGTVFKVTPDGTETVLHAFCREGAGKCADGADPESSLLLDKHGNLWGTTYLAGAYGKGVVFFVTPSGQETVIHSFGSSADDGASPNGGLVRDKAGNIYGTTTTGGANAGAGTVYQIDRQGAVTIVHTFGLSSTDGDQPYGNLAIDAEGNLYGTTLSGGANGLGTVFKVTP